MMIIAIKRRGKNNGDGSAGTALCGNLNHHKAAPANTKSFSNFTRIFDNCGGAGWRRFVAICKAIRYQSVTGLKDHESLSSFQNVEMYRVGFCCCGRCCMASRMNPAFALSAAQPLFRLFDLSIAL